MRTGFQAMTGTEKLPAPLAAVEPFDVLARDGAYPSRGQIVLFGGRAGSMKSTLVTAWALAGGFATLYFAFDQQPRTMTHRLAAAWTGRTVAEVRGDIRAGHAGWYAEKMRHCRMSLAFENNTFGGMGLELDAYLEFWGEWPETIIVDNLSDLVDEHHGVAAYAEAMKNLERLAAVTGASVWVLHHCREIKESSEPPSREDILYRLTQKPEIIYTLGYDPVSWILKLAVVKCRDGVADASARTAYAFQTDPARGLVTGYIGVTHSGGEGWVRGHATTARCP